MREYLDNFDYIDELIQDLQSRRSSEGEQLPVKQQAGGSIPPAGVLPHHECCKAKTYYALVDSTLFDSCKLDN